LIQPRIELPLRGVHLLQRHEGDHLIRLVRIQPVPPQDLGPLGVGAVQDDRRIARRDRVPIHVRPEFGVRPVGVEPRQPLPGPLLTHARQVGGRLGRGQTPIDARDRNREQAGDQSNSPKQGHRPQVQHARRRPAVGVSKKPRSSLTTHTRPLPTRAT